LKKYICRVPLRISLAGGGSDVEPFVSEYGGSVIATTINLFVQTTLFPNLNNGVQINSIDTGAQIFIKEGQPDSTLLNSILSACLTKIPIKNRTGFTLEINSPVPARSGLGASSAIILSIIGVLYSFLKIPFNSLSIAIDAYEVERKLLRIPGGCQDQHVCAKGGFNSFHFKNYKDVKCEDLLFSKKVKQNFEDSAFLIWTGISRNSDFVLEDQINRNIKRQNIESLISQKNLVSEVRDLILLESLLELGEILSRSWELKRNMSDLISNKEIDKIYEIGLDNGAYGGKLLGAGGGGFFLFLAQDKKIPYLKSAFISNGLKVYDFKIAETGIDVRVL
jgi:D-glycero-alpha-D-manno-heptose-7-phosphate kinase